MSKHVPVTILEATGVAKIANFSTLHFVYVLYECCPYGTNGMASSLLVLHRVTTGEESWQAGQNGYGPLG